MKKLFQMKIRSPDEILKNVLSERQTALESTTSNEFLPPEIFQIYKGLSRPDFSQF